MFCYFVRKKFSSYYDGEIKENEKKKIEEHFKKCQKCEREYNLFKKDLEILNSIGLTPAPEYLWEKIKEKITKEKNIVSLKIENSYNYLVKLGIVSSSILILIFSSYFYYNSLRIRDKKIAEFLINYPDIVTNSSLDIQTEYDLILRIERR
jgi:predicted anti-sigma-YlaC factor YlaD